MLTTFPYLLNFQIIAPFLLRIALAMTLLMCCYKTVRKDECNFISCWKSLEDKWLKGVIVSQVVIAVALVLGAFTQIAAILALVSAITKEFVLKKRGEKCTDNTTLTLFVAICFSLLVLGPGIFSLDLPL